MLTPESLPDIQTALRDAGLDGWLLYDFHGVNPVGGGMLALDGMVTRRVFALIPVSGVPIAITHDIEQGPWRRWPSAWVRERYGSWQTLTSLLQRHVGGKRVAMEYVPGDAVPYVDRVPAGVLDMIRSAGATVAPSGDLVSRFYAAWSAQDMREHMRAAEAVAAIARDAFEHVRVTRAAGGRVAEHELQQRVMQAFERAGLESDHPPIVAAGPNAANPHYAPSADRPRHVEAGELLLLDLWARVPGHPYADQTWMASCGSPGARATSVWTAVRDARDAAIDLLRRRAKAGDALAGRELDDAARGVIAERGFAKFFTHRTGHSIDPRELHGSGPHLDNYETREDRLLIPGVGFSIEPGVYIEGEIGARSEVNAFMGGAGGATITPADYQKDLTIV